MKNIINFIEAARSGKLDELGALKTKAGGIDVHNNAGETALIAAAKSSRQEVVEWLIANKANVSLTEYNGYGAIHLASSNGCLDVVKALIEADPDLVNNSNSTLKNWQPLDFALRGNHNEVAKYLYANGGATAILPMPSWLQPSSSTNAQNFNSLAGERELTNSI